MCILYVSSIVRRSFKDLRSFAASKQFTKSAHFVLSKLDTRLSVVCSADSVDSVDLPVLRVVGAELGQITSLTDSHRLLLKLSDSYNFQG